jgi:3',5'-cyclic AMP phosphodiesterase CpdA
VQRLLTLPGNHDIRCTTCGARWSRPIAGTRACFGDELEPELELGRRAGDRREHHPADAAQGRRDVAAQVQRVVQRLQRRPREQLRVVVTHQPACVMRPEDEKDRLRGGEAAVQAWARAGADLVLGGHIHLPYVSDLRASRTCRTPAGPSCVQAGTALSHRVRHGTPNSVNVIRWKPPRNGEARRVPGERWDFDWRMRASS